MVAHDNTSLYHVFSVGAPVSQLFSASLTIISGAAAGGDAGGAFMMIGAVLGLSDSWQTTANAAFMMLMEHAVSWYLMVGDGGVVLIALLLTLTGDKYLVVLVLFCSLMSFLVLIGTPLMTQYSLPSLS